MNRMHRIVMWLLMPIVAWVDERFQQMNQIVLARVEEASKIRAMDILSLSSGIGGLSNRLAGIHESILSLPDYGDRIAELRAEIARTRADLPAILESIDRTAYQTPRLSIGMLMAWEAVAYASEKYEKDLDQHGVTDREKEILAWSAVYMNENGWQVAETDVLLTLLAMRDQVGQSRTVTKHS